jgi:hypothetical protein
LIVELDGSQHAESPVDRQRDRALCALGYRVIRIWNNDVIEKSGRGFSKGPVRTRKIAPHPGPLPASGAREIIAQSARYVRNNTALLLAEQRTGAYRRVQQGGTK